MARGTSLIDVAAEWGTSWSSGVGESKATRDRWAPPSQILKLAPRKLRSPPRHTPTTETLPDVTFFPNCFDVTVKAAKCSAHFFFKV